MKKTLQKMIIPLCVLCSIFAFGLFFGLNSWDNNLYVQWSPSKGRGIAGEDSSAQILSLSYDQLSQKASSALFSKNDIVKEGGLKAFYLGNFLVHNPDLGKHSSICQIFPLVEFSFSAVGITLSGEEGQMIIQSPCNIKDKTFIGPFWIPHQEILANPSKRSFELPDQETFIRFYHASTSLTPSWLLTSVRFFNEEQKDQESFPTKKPEDMENEFIVRFIPGAKNPYFELSLKDTEPVQETVL